MKAFRRGIVMLTVVFKVKNVTNPVRRMNKRKCENK